MLAAALGMAVLMLVGVRMFALKFHGFGWRGNELRYGFILLTAALLLWLGGVAVPFIILLYIVISLVRSAVCRRKNVRGLQN